VFASTRRLPASRCRRWRRPPSSAGNWVCWPTSKIKPAAGFDALTGEVVARAVRALWAGAELPLLSSFSEAALAAARAAVPELPLGMLRALYRRGVERVQRSHRLRPTSGRSRYVRIATP
jgi:hypothetical protein